MLVGGDGVERRKEAFRLAGWSSWRTGQIKSSLSPQLNIDREGVTFDTRGSMALTSVSNKAENEATTLLRQALEITPHLDRGMSLNKLGNAALERFEQCGDPKDIDEAVTLHREALEIHAATHPNWGMSLNDLANAVHTRFEQCGDPKDIDEAIMLHREALEIHAAPHPNQGMSLNNLANAVHTRFEQCGDPKDIDEAIMLHREALEIHVAPHPNQGMSLNNLANAVGKRFQQRGDPKDIDEAIMLHREALEIHAAPHPNWGNSLNNLANAVQTRFEQRGDPNDIDEAITLHREALEIYATPHPNRGMSLNNLAYAVQTRFEQCSDPKDIDEAIMLHREALELRAVPHPDRGGSLNNLANAVQTRFKQCGDPQDIDEAIILHREALEIHAAPHPNQGNSLNNLANAVLERFEQRSDLQDMEEAITLHREALEIYAAPHPNRGGSLNNLANACGDPKDIDEAIMLHREALVICAAPHPGWGMSLNNLANAVHTRFRQGGDAKDIDEAIMLHREALELHTAPHPSWEMSLNNLASAVRTRFEQRGDPKDIDEAIMLHREALEIYAAPHPDQGMSLNNLANVVQTRFEQRGDPKDIDEAIMLYRKALEIHTVPHLDRGMSLNNLANAVQTRFKQRGDPKDIAEAIMLHREALEIHTAPHLNQGMTLNNLAGAVQTRFEHHGDLKDIDEVIMLHREALEIHAAPHPDRGMSLNNLASAIRTRFEQCGDPKDIDEAIMMHRESLELCAALQPSRGITLNNLANAVKTRFEQCGDLKDIDEAIMLHREALELCVAPHPNRADTLNSLADALSTHFQQHGDPTDIDEAMFLHRQAATYTYSSALIRFSASLEWINCAYRQDHGSILDAYHTAINLLPQLAAFSLDLKSRQQMLARKDIVSLASAAATCAIGLKQNNLAVELLEASRSIFWAQALHLRTPVDKLEAVKPELASKLRNLSQQLEQASFRDTSHNILENNQRQLMSLEAVAARCRQLNETWNETVGAVRKVLGFEDFLQPKSIASLQQASVSGPIIILLASDSACSALIMKASEDVQHVPLPALKLQMLQQHYADLPRALSDRTFNVEDFAENHGRGDNSHHQSDLEARLFGAQEDRINMSPNDIFRRVLADIWHTIVKPVFEVLNLKKSDNPSRLWWCPTGPFAFLPIHAAGIYNTDATDCVSDYVISSNTPTLTALLDPPAHNPAFFKMTTVIEPNTPHCDLLPGTELELEKIKTRVPSQWLAPLESSTRDTVLQHLHNSSVIHFACHGTQDFKNPLNSGLILSDGCLDMAHIMQVNNHTHMMKNTMKLAFLSACETAKGDAKTPDEAMHLAASLLFAGFGGVIATMWRMNDDDGPKIADTFYEYLFKDCSSGSASPRVPDLRKAAKALHLAVTALSREPGMTFERWVPFVHYGL
ncbi:CHAT domain-containing protein [Mycena rebaudengoi]|nr:CHAT domain-containing protein [Mycena rebaudengoi]